VRPLVLVADDEAAIRDLVARVITNLGLVALLVADGQAAIAAVAVHRTDLVCAVLDIVMPIVNGVDAARVIQQLEPDLAIVLMSGAVPDHYAGHITRLRLAGMLHKPFSLIALRELILHAARDGVALETAG
jgi:CheY-like chemotaxis protein